MMNKMLLVAVAVFLASANIAYAQDNFMYVTADISGDDMNVESNYNYTTDFEINDFIEKMDGQYIFTFSYSAETGFKNFRLKVILPENAVISEKQDALLVSRPVQISTDGRNIFLEWSGELESGEDFTAFAQYETKGSEINVMLIVLISIIVVSAFLIGYRSKIFKKEKFIEKSVSQDEKLVMNILKKEKEIMQEDLRGKTGWSKTKISKVIRNLEIKNVIEKKPYKKTNKLRLK